ncbi:MAG: histidine kinase [Cyanobacteria bacterium RYN_339]|nr:histidine kinase [Cyanobacteria bacterium RYN_339]
MPTLLQVTSLFNVFGVMLVCGMALVTLRLRPAPFYRAWVNSYLWRLPGSLASAVFTFLGPSWPVLVGMTSMASALSWWLLRAAAELQGRPKVSPWGTGAMVTAFLLGQGLYLGGWGFEAALAPGSLAMMATNVWVGATMIRIGRTPAWAGLGWLGALMLFHGLWFLSFPAMQGTAWHWLGFLVDACLEIGVGAGMVTYMLLRTVEATAASERELRETQSRLEELDRLKQEFLNAASHELRTPLTSIVGYAEFLEDGIGGPLTGDQTEFVAQIHRGAQRLRRIVDDMLDLARVQAGSFRLQPGPSELSAIVQEETLSLLPQARERDVELVVTVPAEPLDVYVDAPRLGQVVLNLVGNALKFTPAGGRVCVSAARMEGGLRVEVTDTGMGIEAAHLPRLFEKFYQVDTGNRRAYGGAGLGLAISKALIEAHGGTLGVTSWPSAGSTFWFTLPGNPTPGPSTGPIPGPGTGVGSPPPGDAG